MDSPNPDKGRIIKDWKKLCKEIGERLAGTREEAGAARYILKELRAAGCGNCHFESFPCRSRRSAKVELQVKLKGEWKSVDCASVTGSGSTKGLVEGDAVWLEMPEQAPLLKPNCLEKKIALLFGSLPEIVDHHIMLCKANPLAVVHVDHRLPFNWPKNDGTYPLWVKKYGFPATVTVPFTEAWNWRKQGNVRVRIQSDMEMIEGESQNVVGELPGLNSNLGPLLVTAHHDSQAGNVGADDNASGVIALLELARLLQGHSLKRTVRFISFGTEEQLSVGAAQYVQAHRKELQSIALVVNIDSVSSPLGHHQLYCTGGVELAEYAQDQLENRGLYVQIKREAVPYADHFPFSVYGVPTLWFFRENFPGGRWQHHSVHDNLENVSADILMGFVSAVYGLINNTAQLEQLPFPRKLDSTIRERTLTIARTLFELP
jgi:hypothetical protein